VDYPSAGSRVLQYWDSTV